MPSQQPQSHKGDQHVQNPKKKAGSHQTQVRHKHERKQERRQQSADVIEREYLRHERLEFQPVLQNSQEQGNLDTYENTYRQHERVKWNAKRIYVGEQNKQD